MVLIQAIVNEITRNIVMIPSCEVSIEIRAQIDIQRVPTENLPKYQLYGAPPPYYDEGKNEKKSKKKNERALVEILVAYG